MISFIHWNFTHVLTLLTLLCILEVFIIKIEFPGAIPPSPEPKEILAHVLQSEMCRHHCPFNATICVFLGYLDTIIENYYITIICLLLIAKILNNMPQKNFFVWLIIHILSFFLCGIVIFSIFNCLLTNKFLCKITQKLIQMLYSNGKMNYLIWNNLMDFYNVLRANPLTFEMMTYRNNYDSNVEMESWSTSEKKNANKLNLINDDVVFINETVSADEIYENEISDENITTIDNDNQEEVNDSTNTIKDDINENKEEIKESSDKKETNENAIIIPQKENKDIKIDKQLTFTEKFFYVYNRVVNELGLNKPIIFILVGLFISISSTFHSPSTSKKVI